MQRASVNPKAPKRAHESVSEKRSTRRGVPRKLTVRLQGARGVASVPKAGSCSPARRRSFGAPQPSAGAVRTSGRPPQSPAL